MNITLTDMLDRIDKLQRENEELKKEAKEIKKIIHTTGWLRNLCFTCTKKNTCKRRSLVDSPTMGVRICSEYEEIQLDTTPKID